ncbi:IS200/IS605 family transposase [Glaesserella parasuis]|uniref:Transposase n=2 Tax=Glaesserella parasuis TaxID=738 RepID=A0A836MFS9_GLAPU|nr:IS200/IS605 family transposase [Glaesserella parasuis]EPZ99784.1 transposase IS200 like family protein [Glaesserella parasuis MN-H]EQA05826.1 transposase IS200 like family protein [Glaesserella parasuis 12939]EQA12430.1 transposase IS200 like family protein [Glaesserella parasuis 174]EQA15066.1 transposase IS200 like family protein [Glaesserella parasuis SW140]AMW17104.1 transposase [Glaesserella parasuis]
MSYTRNLYHIIFRTKYGTPSILEENEDALYRYIWGFVREHNSVLYRINGMPDHLHLFVELHPMLSVAEFVQKLKTTTHKWIDENKHLFPEFYAWSRGYCSLTYCEKDKEKIINYIKNQKEHHKTADFVEEVKFLLTEAGIAINEKFFEQDL